MSNCKLSLEASQKTGIWVASAREQNCNFQKGVNIIREPEWLAAFKKLIYYIIQCILSSNIYYVKWKARIKWNWKRRTRGAGGAAAGAAGPSAALQRPLLLRPRNRRRPAPPAGGTNAGPGPLRPGWIPSAGVPSPRTLQTHVPTFNSGSVNCGKRTKLHKASLERNPTRNVNLQNNWFPERDNPANYPRI